MENVLFINMPSAFAAYTGTKVTAFRQVFPLLSFMSLSAVAKHNGFATAVLDLGIEHDPNGELLRATLRRLHPRIVAITSTTPLFFEVAAVTMVAREELGQDVTIVYGGPHATALPIEALRDSEADIVVTGEGEMTFAEILSGRDLSEISGVYYKRNAEILTTNNRELIKDLDLIPFPDIALYDIARYKCSRLVSRQAPVVHMETSRGCPSKCSFCNKNISGRLFRKKSVERIVAEMEYFLDHGVREIRIIDDQFATDLRHAKAVCEAIIRKGLKFPWNLANGVRVDRVDEEFLQLAKRAGCYQVGIGFESGDERALASIDKEIDLEKSVKCMEMVRRAGIESVGFFMIGLPGDDHESIKKTIAFARRLMPDYAKTTITIPFPGTRLFDQYEREGRIKTRDWSKYNIHKVADVYEHPTLSQNDLRKYYDAFYRAFYFHPKFLGRRLIRSIRQRTLFLDVYYGLQTFLLKN